MKLLYYYFSLGSNLGDRLANLADAVKELNEREIFIKDYSAVYETSPVDCPSGSPLFLNCVVRAETNILPEKLIDIISEIEIKLGRKRSVTNAPRVIDIDVLLAGDLISENKKIFIPHPRMSERLFVLKPLREIAGEFEHPVFKKTIEQIYSNVKKSSTEKVNLFAPSFSISDIPADIKNM